MLAVQWCGRTPASRVGRQSYGRQRYGRQGYGWQGSVAGNAMAGNAMAATPGWLGEKYLGATGESFSLLTLALPEHRWLPGAIALDSVTDKLGQFLRAQATLDAQRFPNTDRKLETRIAPEYRFPTFDEQLDDQELGRSWRSGAPWENIRTLSDRIRARDVFVAHQAGCGARSANGESVLWRSVLLKPGATQTLSVHLPENRSGWRFEVFAADAEGGFQRLLLDAPSGKSE